MSTIRMIFDLILPEQSLGGLDFRKRLEWFMLLRLVVTTLLLGATIVFQARSGEATPSGSVAALYTLIGVTFLLSLLYAFALPLIPNAWRFAFFQSMVDVVYYTVLVYFTGGVASAFSMIYVFPVIASGILHLRRGALITASAAAVLFGLLVVLEFYGTIPESNWPWVSSLAREAPHYALWVLVVHFTVFFLAAWLSSSIAEQLQRTRAVLNVRETDYNKLSDLHSNIVRSIPNGIITTDESDRVTYVNAPGTRLLGSTLANLVSVRIADIFPTLGENISTSGVRQAKYETVKEIAGEKALLELSVSDLRGVDGLYRGRLIVFQDVTHLKRMEERIKRNEQQAALVRVAAGMAHEIRNPLAALRGAAELLSRLPADGPKNRKLMDIVVRESDRLNSLLSDFLVTVNPGRVRSSRVMLNDVVREAVELFSKDPKVAGKYSLETLINTGVEVNADPPRIKQAVWNLLTNAVEACPNGGLVRVILESDPDSGQAVLIVQDNGPGIPPELGDRIFEPFTTTKESGTGLGLPIILSIIEAHNGTIEFESSPGGGTRFIVRLPLANGVWTRPEGARNGL